MRTIAVGSTSKHKLSAVEDALARADMEAVVQGVQTASGVPEQPIGLDMTRRGALNRARAALTLVPGADAAVGIESGLVEVDCDAYLDLAVVALIDRSYNYQLTVSAGVPVPLEYVKASMATGLTKTAGEFIAEATGCDATDWQGHATGGHTSRHKLLEVAVLTLLATPR